MAVALVGGDDLGAVFEQLLKAITDVKNASLYKDILQSMASTIEQILKVMTGNEKMDDVLQLRKEETEEIVEEIRKGKNLVLESSKVKLFICCFKPNYADRLRKLEESLKLFLEIVTQVQQARKIKEKEKVLFSCVAPGAPKDHVGLDIPLGQLKKDMLQDDISMVVLSGPPGCGKTALAQLFCNDKEVKEKFKGNIFFVVMSKKTTLEVILQMLLKHKGHQLPVLANDEQIVHRLELFLKEIGPSPILLVLDDVQPESKSLLDKFKLQITGYKILVTSRRVFQGYGPTHKLTPLKNEDAMTLFHKSAFLPHQTSDIPDDVVTKIVKECKGFPLALKAVGRSLCGQPVEIWKAKEIELSKKVGAIFQDNDLKNCLQSSLDALDNMVIVKECFQDLSSFPEDFQIPATALIDMWAESYKLDEDGMSAVAKLHKLSNQNLVDLVITRKYASDGYNEHFILQHDLLRQLAMQHISKQSIEQRKRVIVEISANNFPDWWKKQQLIRTSARLLSISTDEEFSSGWCDMQAPEAEVLILSFRGNRYDIPKFINKMKNLKVLIAVNHGSFPAELSNFLLVGSLSNLKRIRLEQVSVPPSGFTTVQLPKLRKIALVRCEIGHAFSSYNFPVSEALPNLEEISIEYCNNLTELPAELCEHVRLKKLSIINCHKLTALPNEIGQLKNLEDLRLISCMELAELPRSIGNLHKLSILDISECAKIMKLPEEIGQLRSLREFYMTGYPNNSYTRVRLEP